MVYQWNIVFAPFMKENSKINCYKFDSHMFNVFSMSLTYALICLDLRCCSDNNQAGSLSPEAVEVASSSF
jgi:hypothetical protein